jgi:hypothetical protein
MNRGSWCSVAMRAGEVCEGAALPDSVARSDDAAAVGRSIAATATAKPARMESHVVTVVSIVCSVATHDKRINQSGVLILP